MTNLNHSLRPKVKGDTFFLPDPNGGVYFRNNVGSFRMEGDSISQWIEKLIPVFDGEHTLRDLTDGLPYQYRKQVYEIVETLYTNGFLRDLSQDRPHQLPGHILQRYASQIGFLDNLCESPVYRFESYRQTNVLAVGSGPFLLSLVTALLESGLPKIHVLVTDSMPTNRQRLAELVRHAQRTDPEVEVQEIARPGGDSNWREIIRPFDSILYVSEEGNVEELRVLHTACREEKKVFMSAMFIQQVGVAGPLVHPRSEPCWESAWRRMHQSALCSDSQGHNFSSTAGAMLSNVIVFELFKMTTGVTESELHNKFFRLDLETLEGNWHYFMPHPLVTGHASVELVQDLEQWLERSPGRGESSQELLPFFGMLTSPHSGFFHTWDEGELIQLPLSQCRVQVTDPLSNGPAELLPEVVCTGLTHYEARREAGLTGIEAYALRMVDLLFAKLPGSHEDSLVTTKPFVGVGAGETTAEGVCRGLQKCLTDALYMQQENHKPQVILVRLNDIEDEHCQFYAQALTAMQGDLEIGVGQEVFGFPVVWVGTSDRWYGSVGFNVTAALRSALQQALLVAQNQAASLTRQVLEASSVVVEDGGSRSLSISSQDTSHTEILESALTVLKRNRQRVFIFHLDVEPFLKQELAGVFGVVLREEESP